ncbi:response regulator [Clostridium malenominatum]|uniref:Stage 0 sporulation protein A homolog n=1 Tax=Clostridium malenominatum TaxID=1539 RepID=A0ABN1J0U3_9CLOT
MFKILIVEDEDIIRKGLIYMMNWVEIECIVVGESRDGEEGLKMIESLAPDIVITDIRMPFKDGIQMLEESIEKYKYEAIIISGYSEFEYAKKAISLGVSEYLLKPIDFKKLAETINNLKVKINKKTKFKEYVSSLDKTNIYKDILDITHYSNIKKKSSYVKNMIDYIQENYPKKISITDVSKIYNLSTVYLNSIFKEETNYTFNDFLNRYRILKSVELLKQGNLMIYEIADSVGIETYKYFSQVFKKYIGKSPTEFIKDVND